MKKNILIFGDSNTYGYNPRTNGRYDKSRRWSGILSDLLGEDYHINEEGCNNRTAFFINPDGKLQSGLLYIDDCLKKYSEIDIFIFALGSNDLQKFYNFNPKIIENGLDSYLKKIKSCYKNIRIILIPPVQISEDIQNGFFKTFFNKNSLKNMEIMQNIYNKFALNNKITLFDINKFTKPSKEDGLHYDEASHKIIAEQLAQLITKLPYFSN